MPTSEHLKRRQFLSIAGAAGLTSLAGCGGRTLQASGSGEDGDGGHSDEEHGADDARDRQIETNLPYTGDREIVDLSERGNQLTLTVVPRRHSIHPEGTVGGEIELPFVWAFKPEGGDASVPGPVIRVEEGTDFTITIKNEDPTGHSHTFHLHAQERSWRDDGAPKTSGEKVEPGTERDYEFTATVPGNHMYHCHVNTAFHMDMGMYGVLRVDPSERSSRGHGRQPDREYFYTFREWDSRVSDFHAQLLPDEYITSRGGGLGNHATSGDETLDPSDRDPDLFTFNGRAAPTTFFEENGYPVIVEEDDLVRLHFANMGFESHSMHTHAHQFDIIERQAEFLAADQQHQVDVLNVGSAERYTVQFEADADPGIYPFHCHRAHHNQNNGEEMGGMMNVIAYESKLDTEEYRGLRDPNGSSEEGGHGGHGGHDGH